jgi:uncharacterized membrane protein
VYPPAKQFSDLVFTSEGKSRFERVVLVPYPSENSLALGFVTNEDVPQMNRVASAQLLAVLVPFGPTPFTGVLLYFSSDAVRDVDITIDNAIKIIVSAGVISAADTTPTNDDRPKRRS